jgi:hypothetical protein
MPIKWRIFFPEDVDKGYEDERTPAVIEVEHKIWDNYGTLIEPGTGSVYKKAGVWGDIPSKEVIGYVQREIMSDGTTLYMPVTRHIQAINALEQVVENTCPGLAECVRTAFDKVEEYANNHPNGTIHKLGPSLIKFGGTLSELILGAIGRYNTIGKQYKDNMINPNDFLPQKESGTAFSLPNVIYS